MNNHPAAVCRDRPDRAHSADTTAVLKQIAQALACLHGAEVGVFLLNGMSAEGFPGLPNSCAIPVTGRDGSPIGTFLCYAAGSFTPRERDDSVVSALLTAAALADENDRLKIGADALAAELSKSREFLEEFIRSALHDLRSPFVTVSNMVQLLGARHMGEENEPADEMISLTMRAVDRGLSLLSDLSTYALIGASHEEPAPIELRDTVDAALVRLERAVRQSGAVITVGELPMVTGRRADIEQVWIQVIENALTFHGPSPPRVHISAEEHGLQWLLSVSDNGTGFDSRYAAQIFEPFKRLCGSGFPGSGLGLPICKKIIELHEGRIWAESEPGKGSVFRFTLPANATG